MKALVKLAVGGLIALAAATQAYAQTPAQLLSAAGKTPAGRAFLAQMGINSATSAGEVANILKGLSAAERATISRAVNTFNAKAKLAGNDQASLEKAGADAFMPNGKLLVVVAANSQTINRDGVNAVADDVTCSAQGLARDLANKQRKVSEGELTDVIKDGYISVGVCGGGLLNYQENAVENYVQMRACERRLDAKNLPIATRENEVGPGCLPML